MYSNGKYFSPIAKLFALGTTASLRSSTFILKNVTCSVCDTIRQWRADQESHGFCDLGIPEIEICICKFAGSEPLYER